jgi:hypothetical protein
LSPCDKPFLLIFSILFFAQSLYFKGNPLFPDGCLDEQVDGRRHADAGSIAKCFKLLFEV